MLSYSLLQQHLPFTVLKPSTTEATTIIIISLYMVATAPTVYGIETILGLVIPPLNPLYVATAPTVYGIETSSGVLPFANRPSCNSTYRLRY